MSSYSRLVVRRLQVVQQIKSEQLRQTSKTISEKLVQKQHKPLGQSEQSTLDSKREQQQNDNK